MAQIPVLIINKHVAYETHYMAITILQSEVDIRENNSCDVRADFAEMMSGSTICLSLLCPQKHHHLFHLWPNLILNGHRLGLQVFIEGFLSCWSEETQAVSMDVDHHKQLNIL